MIETRCLKNVVIFIQTILSFVLSRKIINIYNDIARKYGNVTVNNFYGFIRFTSKDYLFTPTNTLSDAKFLSCCCFGQIGLYVTPWLQFFVLRNSWS